MGLRLLRPLFNDHEEGKRVEIIGCNQGLDWFVKHEDGLVTIGADENLKTTYYYLQYKKEKGILYVIILGKICFTYDCFFVCRAYLIDFYSHSRYVVCGDWRRKFEKETE